MIDSFKVSCFCSVELHRLCQRARGWRSGCGRVSSSSHTVYEVNAVSPWEFYLSISSSLWKEAGSSRELFDLLLVYESLFL